MVSGAWPNNPLGLAQIARDKAGFADDEDITLFARKPVAVRQGTAT
jgi:hypothetical protein